MTTSHAVDNEALSKLSAAMGHPALDGEKDLSTLLVEEAARRLGREDREAALARAEMAGEVCAAMGVDAPGENAVKNWSLVVELVRAVSQQCDQLRALLPHLHQQPGTVPVCPACGLERDSDLREQLKADVEERAQRKVWEHRCARHPWLAWDGRQTPDCPECRRQREWDKAEKAGVAADESRELVAKLGCAVHRLREAVARAMVGLSCSCGVIGPNHQCLRCQLEEAEAADAQADRDFLDRIRFPMENRLREHNAAWDRLQRALPSMRFNPDEARETRLADAAVLAIMATDRLRAWVGAARPWVQDKALRHQLDDIVPPRKREAGA